MRYNSPVRQVFDLVIGILGAGASGMAAAWFASRDPAVQVKLLERQGRVGRKLSATGNGRCNLSNLHAGPGGYHGEDTEFAAYALREFPVDDTLQWFRRLGLFTVAEPSGRVYPYSDQANSVVDVLRFALEQPNVELICDFEVTKLRSHGSGFTIFSGERTLECDKVIVACGGLAGTKLGGTMSGYKLLRSLGHKCTRLRPALVQVKSGWPGVVGLKGVRANCHAAIYGNGRLHRESTGELQFTETGLSGPVIFEISRDVCTGGVWECHLDCLPQVSRAELEGELLGRKGTGLSSDDILTGILHNRLGRVLTKLAGIPGHTPVSQLPEFMLSELAGLVKHWVIPITEPLGMDSAQVTAGGIRTDEFDPRTMESRLVPGLYACGEVLDIDGDCGGYNLQWAWSSGRLAGISAGKDAK